MSPWWIVICSAKTRTSSQAGASPQLVDLSAHSLDEIVHALERDVRLRLLHACGDDFVALERPLVDDHGSVRELRLRFIGFLLRVLRHWRAIGRHLDEALLEAAAH